MSATATPAIPPATPPAEMRAASVRGARYGIALTAVLLGVFLVLQWSPAALLGPQASLWALQAVAQLAIGIVVLAGGLAAAPTSLLRSLLAAVIAVVLVIGAAVLLYLRATGVVRGGPPLLWAFLGLPTAALLSGLLGWLVVRRRPLIAYVLLLGVFLPALVRHLLLLSGVETAVIWFSDVALSLVVGVVVAWMAFGAAMLLRSVMRGSRA
jgi:hypothetical protein